MVYVIAFNSTAEIAWWIGIIFTVLSLFCIGLMVYLRGRDSYLKNRSNAISQKWKKTLQQVTDSSTEDISKKGQEVYRLNAQEKKNLLVTLHEKGRFGPVEPLKDQEVPDFLFLWNYQHESIKGPSKDNLNSLAEILEVKDDALKMLQGASVKDQILAINTLGNLHEKSAYSKIEKEIFKQDPVISLWTWRALFRIDFEKTLTKHLSMIASRQDWSPTFVAKVLLEFDKTLLAQPLVDLVEENYQKQICEKQMSRLISYLRIINEKIYIDLVNRILNESDETEVLIACLRLTSSKRSLPRIRELLKSERWEIRHQVVQTLGRIGLKKDVKLLISALGDLDWWVRYRAASSLIKMPYMNEEKIEKLAETLPNEFSRDILHQVIAEMQLLCYTSPSSTILSK